MNDSELKQGDLIIDDFISPLEELEREIKTLIEVDEEADRKAP